MDSSSLDEKLKLIEARLARIEAQLNLSPLPQPTSPAKPPVINPSRDVAQIKQETKSGNWLGIIAILCFVLAAGFMIKLSIESGWLTPARQIGIAVLFGLGLIEFGMRFLDLDKEYTSLLPGCGIIILYLSAFAAHRLHYLISFELAIIMFGVISLLCMYLYLKIKHDIYPLTAAVGAYLAPVFLGLNVNAFFSLYYFVICSVTFSLLSIWVHSRLLIMISAYFAILLTAYIGIDLQQDKIIAIVLGLHFLIFSMGTCCYTLYTRQPLSEKESWSFFPILLIFYVAEYHFLYLINPDLAAWLSLTFAAFLIVLYVLAKTVFGSGIVSQSMLMTFVSIVAFHAGYIELLPAAAGPWLFVVIMLGFALFPARISQRETNIWLYTPIFLLLFVIVGIEYAKMIFNLFVSQPVSWPAISVSIICIWMLYICQKNFLTKDESYGYALLGAAHLMVVLALYQLADAHGSLAVSASWLIYAIGIILFAFTRKDKIMANSALFVLFFSAAKALLYDASSVPTVIRILCLLLTGVVLYGAGFLFRRIAKW